MKKLRIALHNFFTLVLRDEGVSGDFSGVARLQLNDNKAL